MSVPVSTTNRNLNTIPFDPELTPGARNAVNVCLRVQPGEKVTVITDEATKDIAASMVRELEAVGAPYRAWALEDLAPRPLGDLPQEILEDLETSQVSIFAVQAQANELHSRMQMTDVVNRRHMRHAHMVNITPEIMCQGMRADFNRVDRLSQQVLERVRTRPVLNVDEESVTVGQMIDYLRRRLSLEDRPIRLKQMLLQVSSRQALVCMFLALLELVRLQAIQVRQEKLFGEIAIRKHTHFDEVMNEQAAVRDDWR